MVQRSLKRVRRIFIAIAGATILAMGVAMVVLPGPAVVVIPLGLGILATEFAWARLLLHRIRDRISRNGESGSSRER